MARNWKEIAKKILEEHGEGHHFHTIDWSEFDNAIKRQFVKAQGIPTFDEWGHPQEPTVNMHFKRMRFQDEQVTPRDFMFHKIEMWRRKYEQSRFYWPGDRRREIAPGVTLINDGFRNYTITKPLSTAKADGYGLVDLAPRKT